MEVALIYYSAVSHSLCIETGIQSTHKLVSSLLAFINVAQDGQVETPAIKQKSLRNTSFNKALYVYCNMYSGPQVIHGTWS